jgi:DNA-binding NtrC family response regulator
LGERGSAVFEDEPVRTTLEGNGPPPPGPSLRLVFREEGALRRLALEPGLVSLGSHPENTLVLRDPQVSRFHCRLHLREDGRLWLRDLGSRNGSWVDGLRVVEAELLLGAVVRLGGQELRIEGGPPQAAEAQAPGLVSCDPVMAPVLERLQRVAPARLPVLLHGETGTGKEVAARALHSLSPRRDGPFVPLNCGAIAPELAESELFGHERGAFTGAVGQSPGAFGAADGGTLFLDEVAELPLPLQVKLLRALEADEVKPVGAARPRRVDVRIVAATHRDLRALVASGAFREDLYYRLRGAELTLPPLRARRRDILPLAEQLLAAEGGGRLGADARELLLAHAWPGNVRELRQVLRLGRVLCEGEVIRARDLALEGSPLPQAAPAVPAGLSVHEPVPAAAATPVGGTDGAGLSVALGGRTLEELEAMAIRASFLRNHGVRRAMARELGIAKSSLLRKLAQLGLREKAELRLADPADKVI